MTVTQQEITREEIESLDVSRTNEPHLALSQLRLAEELTRQVHGAAGLAAAQCATQVLFGGEIQGLDDSQLTEIFADVPSRELSQSALDGEGLGLIDAFVTAGLASSKGEARRTLRQGGVYVNNRRAENDQQRLTAADLAGQTVIVLRSGRKKYALLRFQ